MLKTNSHSTLKRWGALFLGLGMIMFFSFVVAPFAQRWGPIKTLHTFIQENNIDATPLFYTESEEFSEAEFHIRNSLKYD